MQPLLLHVFVLPISVAEQQLEQNSIAERLASLLAERF